jgi:hypothetical protein
VYVSNWGTRRFILRMPAGSIDIDEASEYCVDETLTLWEKDGYVLLEYYLNDEEPTDWVEGEGWLASLRPLRDDLMAGDLRSLYLAWLAGVKWGPVGEDEPEPPVPPGLNELSPPLKSLAEFLDIDQDLVEVAAQASPSAATMEITRQELTRWIAALSEAEKQDLLLRFIEGEDARLRSKIMRTLREQRALDVDTGSGPAERRSAGYLAAAALHRYEDKRRRKAERAAREQAEKERRQALQRIAYLKTLSGRTDELWNKVKQLIATTRPRDHATQGV